MHEWDLTLQRDLSKNIVLEMGYIGKRGMHLLRAYDLNQVTLRPDFLQAFVAAQKGTCTVANGCVIARIFAAPLPAPLKPCGFSLSSSTVVRKLNANEAGGLAALLDQFCFNQVLAAGLPANFFRPNPQFGRFFYLDAGGDSNYNALQIHVRRHEPNLDFGAAYTFAKSIDDMSVDPVGATSSGALGNNSRTPTDIHNFRADRGRSDFDRTHVLTGYWVWNLPFGRGQRWGHGVPGFLNQIIGGWTGSGLATFMTGEPFSVLSGRFTNSNIRNSRADIVGPKPDTDLFFNVPGVTGPILFNFTPGSFITSTSNPHLGCLPLANGQTFFCTPPPGSNGNQGRNAFAGPNFFNMDLSIAKGFNVTERWKLQFRADFFNAFNHPNFDNPLNSSSGSTSMSSSVFAQTCCVTVSVPSSSSVIAIGEPYRVIQFALRVSF